MKKEAAELQGEDIEPTFTRLEDMGEEVCASGET